MIYGPDKDKLQIYPRSFRAVRLLETVAERASDEWIWRAPFSLEAQSCGEPGSRWHLPTRTLTLCYKMAADFAQLYRDHASYPALPRLKFK